MKGNVFQVLQNQMKKNLLTGFLVLVPIAVTFWVAMLIVNKMDSILAIKDGRFFFALPESLHPNNLMGFKIPFLGVVVTLIIIYLVGLLMRNVLGGRILSFADGLIDHIPFVRVVYKATKQLLIAVTMQQSEVFRRVVMVEFPRDGIYSIGFVTGSACTAIQKQAEAKEEHLNVFIPCTPNPTTGYYVVVPRSQVRDIAMPADDAFKVLISAGLFNPDSAGDSWDRITRT